MDLIHNTRAPERASVIQKPTAYNEHEEPSSIEAEKHYIEMIVEFVSQAAQHYPAVKETVNEETVKEETVKEEPLTIKLEPKEFPVMDWTC
jgi:hypothetical protein